MMMAMVDKQGDGRRFDRAVAESVSTNLAAVECGNRWIFRKPRGGLIEVNRSGNYNTR